MMKILAIVLVPCLAPLARAAPPTDIGWWTRCHALAISYDGATTGLVMHNCAYCTEKDPVTRPLIGRRASDWRMMVFGSGEVLGVAMIPNKKLRRVAQIGLIGIHLWEGSRNLRYR